MKGTGVLEQMKMIPPPTAIKVPVGGTSKWVEVGTATGDQITFMRALSLYTSFVILHAN